jgi:hypothetical protein
MQPDIDPIELKIEEIAQLDKLQILMIWERASKFLSVYRDCEMQLRKLVVERFGDPSKDAGTETYELAQGFKLKIRKSLTYSVSDNEEFEAICSEIPNDIQRQIFKFKPSLIKDTYEKLTDAQKSVLSPVVTIKPAATQIEIAVPKEKD